MTIGSSRKKNIPARLRDFLRSITRGQPCEYLWEGVYSEYKDAPAKGDGFNGDYWISRTRTYTEESLFASKNHGSIPTAATGEYMLLPLLASLVCRESRRGVNILDFGGGMGIAYVHLVSSLMDCPTVDFHIIESEKIAEEGKRLFEADDRIHFHTQLPAQMPDLDIIFMSSSLQYIENYRSLLKTLSAYEAKYFLFVKLSAGDFPTYATAQKNVPGSTLPYWFINVDEIIEIMATSGYRLLYKSALEQEYDQSNFPEEYRLGRACNLLFSRN